MIDRGWCWPRRILDHGSHLATATCYLWDTVYNQLPLYITRLTTSLGHGQCLFHLGDDGAEDQASHFPCSGSCSKFRIETQAFQIQGLFSFCLCLWLIKYPSFLASLGKHHHRKCSLVVFPIFQVCLSVCKQSRVYPERYEYSEKRSFSGLDGCASMDRRAWAPSPPIIGQLPAGSSAFLVPVSLLDFLPGPRVCFCNCWCMVFGMFVGGCFLFGFCYLPFVVVALASFLAAQMFCGFQAGRLEKCTTSEGFIRSSGS